MTDSPAEVPAHPALTPSVQAPEQPAVEAAPVPEEPAAPEEPRAPVDEAVRSFIRNRLLKLAGK